MEKISAAHARLILADPFAVEEKWLLAYQQVASPKMIASYADPSQPIAVKLAIALLWGELMVVGACYVSSTVIDVSTLVMAVILFFALSGLGSLICEISRGVKVARKILSAFILLNLVVLKLPYGVFYLSFGDNCVAQSLCNLVLPVSVIWLLHTRKSNWWFQCKEDERFFEKSQMVKNSDAEMISVESRQEFDSSATLVPFDAGVK